MVKIIIFDFDGVIINSINVQKEAFHESYKIIVGNDGISSFDTFLTYSGNSLQNIFQQMGLPFEMIDIYKKISREKMDQIEIYNGMEEFIKESNYKGYKCCLCTGKDRERTIEILTYFHLIQYFKVIICSDDVHNPKPHAESINIILDSFNRNFDSAVMIGDAKNDILCANNAGISSIGVTWGCCTYEELEECKPDRIVNSVSELGNILWYR